MFSASKKRPGSQPPIIETTKGKVKVLKIGFTSVPITHTLFLGGPGLLQSKAGSPAPLPSETCVNSVARVSARFQAAGRLSFQPKNPLLTLRWGAVAVSQRLSFVGREG